MKKALIVGGISTVATVLSTILGFWAMYEESKVEKEMIDNAVSDRLEQLLDETE